MPPYRTATCALGPVREPPAARGRVWPPWAPGCSPASTWLWTTAAWTPARPVPTWSSRAESALDLRTPRGRVPAEVARRAKLPGRPVLALAGTLGEGEGAGVVPGVDACHGIPPAPMESAEALPRAGELLADATERALRMIVPGTRLPAQAEVSGTQRPSSVR